MRAIFWPLKPVITDFENGILPCLEAILKEREKSSQYPNKMRSEINIVANHSGVKNIQESTFLKILIGGETFVDFANKSFIFQF